MLLQNQRGKLIRKQHPNVRSQTHRLKKKSKWYILLYIIIDGFIISGIEK